MDSAQAPKWALVPCSKIAPKKVKYLLWPLIPEGKLVVLEGEAGGGKTWAAVALARLLSRGHVLSSSKFSEEELNGEPAKVVFLNFRDSAAEILRPRLEACGTDLSRVLVLAGRRAGTEEVPDLEEISKILEREKPKLLVLDPLEACWEKMAGPGFSKAAREFARGLATLAGCHGCTILALHRRVPGFAGRGERRAALELSNAAASVLRAARDPDNPPDFVLAHVRSCNSAEGASQGFEIRDGAFRWTGPKDVAAGELPAFPQRPRELLRGKKLLEWLLKEAPRPAEDIFRAAESEGVRRKTLYRAKQALGISSRQREREWWWALPATENKEQRKDVSSNAPQGRERAGESDGDTVVPASPLFRRSAPPSPGGGRELEEESDGPDGQPPAPFWRGDSMAEAGR